MMENYVGLRLGSFDCWSIHYRNRTGVGSPWFGRLPGDIRFEGERVRFYFPLPSGLLLSLILSELIWLIRWLVRSMSSCVQIHILHINRAYFAGDAGKEKTLGLHGSARPVGYFHPRNSAVLAKFESKSKNRDPSLS